MASERAQILITAVDQTKQAFASAKSSLENLSSVTEKLNGLFGLFGAAATLSGLIAIGKHAIEAADGLNDMSQRTGVSVESLSTLRRVAEMSGTSLEGLEKGIKGLATHMFDAARGSKESAELFSRLGVDVRDATGNLRATDQVLMEIADRFAAMPDGPEKAALAVKIFGKAGMDLIPMLNLGAKGINEIRAKFKEMSSDTAKAADAFNDKLVELKAAFGGVASRLTMQALPAMEKLADLLLALVKNGNQVSGVIRVLGEVITAAIAIRGVAAVMRLIEAAGTLRAVFMRFLPILAAVAVWEMGRGIYKMVQDIKETNRAIEDLNRQREQLNQLNAALNELATTGTLSLKSQMWLAAQAAERLKAALPGMETALRGVQGAATQVGEAIRQALDDEIKKAAETVKQLSASYKQVAADIKAIWDARVAEIESNYKRQEAAAQNAARSESTAIRESAQTLLAAEREKLAAVEAGARQMESAWKTTYGQAVALARTAGQDVQAIERQAVDARIAIYSQLESAYRATVDRLIAEEQRHLAAAKAADEARLNLRLSIEDRIRELSRKGMDEYAAYQDRLRQIDEKQAQARAALAAGNFEQARKLAEESIALAERSASAVTRQVEQNGKTITQTVVSDATAAANAISQIKESAGIADAALKGLGDAHKQAASAAGAGADEAKRALASVSSELEKLRQQLLAQDKLKLDIDIEAAKTGIEKLKALTDAQQLVAKIQVDTKEAQASLEKLKADTDNLSLVAKVEADTAKVMADIDRLKSTLSGANVEIPAVVSFDQPRAQMASFAQDARTVLSAPTEASHTPRPDMGQYRAALSELLRPTSSTHTIYVQKVYTNAQGGLIQKLAEGGQAVADGFKRMSGRIFGPGTETSDSVPALLSHGEFVVRAASVRKFGEGFFAALNAGFLPTVPRFAAGGAVANTAAQVAMAGGSSAAPARDVVDLRFHVGGKPHTVQSSRETAMQLAQALREISRGA